MGDHWLGYCDECKQQFHINVNNKKAQRELFRKDTLQPGGHNLYFKYYGKLNVI